MKTRRLIATLLAMVVILCSTNVSVATVNAKGKKLDFSQNYVILPAMDLRIAPNKPGAIDTLKAGKKVEVVKTQGIWAKLRYKKHGEVREGWTWAGSVGPAIRIHLLKDEFVFHKPVYDRTALGSISTWREPSDPDLLILWQEDDDWVYIQSLDGRTGYMRANAKYVIK